jgi:UDP-N-acetylglucosamine--N-acetylmuramyl-(pentapeptide) pyrophosphoryl-undecaprenol N-acetylglucosamine transferase
MAKQKTILFVGADTGGHVVPVFALAKEFIEKTKYKVTVIGVGTATEKNFYSQIPRARYIKIIAGKFQFKSFFNNVFSAIKTAIGFIQSIFILISDRPAVIFLKGNYATVPVAYAARILRIPLFAHESDAVIGKSNKLIAKFADKLFLSYPLEIYKDNISNGFYSGPILRPEIESKTPGDYKRFGFDKNKKTILIIGGSQGSHSINKAVLNALDELLPLYQIIHQTGTKDAAIALEKKRSLKEEYSKRYFTSPFINDVHGAISAADLVISRASSTIFELAAASKASILIPYPHASLNHQTENAKYFENKNAAVVVYDKNLSPTILYSAISKILSTDKKRSELASNISKSVKLNGRETVFNYLSEKIRN